jgi:4-amino-4-deoxychorismate lyase
VISATSGNLFAHTGGAWQTPGVRDCGVAGVARGWLLSRLELAREAQLTPADIENAEAIFLCNSVRGILPVSRLGQRQWSPDPRIAAIRRQLAEEQPAFRHLES